MSMLYSEAFSNKMFGSKVVRSPSCSLGVKNATQETAKDNSRHFDLWLWPQGWVQNTVLLESAAHCTMLYRRIRDFLLFKVNIVVDVKCLLFPPLHFLVLRNCCENHRINIKMIGSYPVAAFSTDWKFFHLTVVGSEAILTCFSLHGCWFISCI